MPLLAKLSNFVPDGGIWMNTQRPEWNDANNALGGLRPLDGDGLPRAPFPAPSARRSSPRTKPGLPGSPPQWRRLLESLTGLRSESVATAPNAGSPPERDTGFCDPPGKPATRTARRLYAPAGYGRPRDRDLRGGAGFPGPCPRRRRTRPSARTARTRVSITATTRSTSRKAARPRCIRCSPCWRVRWRPARRGLPLARPPRRTSSTPSAPALLPGGPAHLHPLSGPRPAPLRRENQAAAGTRRSRRVAGRHAGARGPARDLSGTPAAAFTSTATSAMPRPRPGAGSRGRGTAGRR